MNKRRPIMVGIVAVLVLAFVVGCGGAAPFSVDEGVVGAAAAEDGSRCNEHNTLIDSKGGGEARCQQEMELDPGEWGQ